MPIRRFSEDGRVREFRPGRRDGHPPQVAVEPSVGETDDPLAPYPVEEVTWVGDGVLCRLPTVGPVSAFERSGGAVDGRSPPVCENFGEGSCLAYGFSFLPVEPTGFTGATDGCSCISR